jgi:glycerol-3-phosphate dehydrogenase (NAD(P)+)
MKLCILGSGAWGTAVATVLAQNGSEVALWCRESEVVQDIKTTRINKQFLPDVKLNEEIVAVSSLSDALDGAELIFAAVPVKFFRSVLEQVKPCLPSGARWVVLNKGIEQETLLLPSQIVHAVLGDQIQTVALVGPSFAKDLAQKQLTAVEGAGPENLVQEVQELLQNNYFRVEPSQDVVGVQLCAALKNVITLAVGMLDGAGYTDNTKALFLVRSLAEMKELVVACGGQSQTVDGFAGIGDLVLTALGQHSRNLAVGKRLGQGESLQAVLESDATVAEGINTTTSIEQLIEQKKLELPLLTGIYQMVKKGLPVKKFIENLF